MTASLPEFPSFAALMTAHVEGRDFERVVKRVAGARVVILAPHGGRIEPRTEVIAASLAGSEFSLYSFVSKLPTTTANLHITSHHFDDPDCLDLVAQHEYVLAIHGWRHLGSAVMVGGLDAMLRGDLSVCAESIGVAVHTGTGGLSGLDANNICNRGLLCKGAQLELSMDLRNGAALPGLVKAIRQVLLQRQNAASQVTPSK